MSRTSENSLAELSSHYEQTVIDEPTADLTYVGFAGSGIAKSEPYWTIMKIEKVGTETTIKWATSYKNKANIWDNRAALTYTT